MKTELIDIHHHILYGVDDGPASFEETDRMLARAYEQNTRHIIATPHYDGKTMPDQLLLTEQIEQLNAHCEKLYPGLVVHQGGELYYRPSAIEHVRTGRIPMMADSNYLLVEFSLQIMPDAFEQAIRQVTNEGIGVIVAHSERYDAVFGNIDRMAYFKDKYDILYQVNADTIIGKESFLFKRKLKKLIRHGMIDFIASDAHSTNRRSSHLKEAYTYLLNHEGQATADALCRDNAAQYLKLM